MDDNKDKLDSSNKLKASLLKQLDVVGYPVELKVGNILSKNNWRVKPTDIILMKMRRKEGK